MCVTMPHPAAGAAHPNARASSHPRARLRDALAHTSPFPVFCFFAAGLANSEPASLRLFLSFFVGCPFRPFRPPAAFACGRSPRTRGSCSRAGFVLISICARIAANREGGHRAGVGLLLGPFAVPSMPSGQLPFAHSDHACTTRPLSSSTSNQTQVLRLSGPTHCHALEHTWARPRSQ